MKNKANTSLIYKIIILTMSVLLFWVVEIFYILPLTQLDIITQVMIGMFSLPILLCVMFITIKKLVDKIQ